MHEIVVVVSLQKVTQQTHADCRVDYGVRLEEEKTLRRTYQKVDQQLRTDREYEDEVEIPEINIHETEVLAGIYKIRNIISLRRRFKGKCKLHENNSLLQENHISYIIMVGIY